MESKGNLFNVILVIVILISLVLLFLANTNAVTGFVTEGTATSNVTISKALAIDFSTNLSTGIQFGNVQTLPATNINATHNYDGTSDSSTFYINVSTDSNTNVDFCIKGSGDLESAALDAIGLGNETYATNVSSSTLSSPDVGDENSLTTSYVRSATDFSPGTANYFRFWLDVPGAQPSGDYNNTVSFKGVVTTLSCGA